ncbi:MAG: TetR/AcrR family transcriptional regulator [Leptolyngbyaceae bacterium]|nr:TetR/AcrR family transcriptional regulator [Leptolyngbyaceae bacterium]
MAKTKTSNTPSPPPLSRERILQVALRLADEGGLEALSMRKVAQALGVKAMSLYNHVASKDDIIDGIVDIVVSDIELPRFDLDWKTAMRQRALSAHEVLLKHPWAAMAIMSRINVGPAMLRYVDRTIGCLREAGFSWRMADYAWNAIDSHIYGFTLQELNYPVEASKYSETAESFISYIPPDQYPYMHQLSLYIIDGSYDGVYNFEFGLDFVLDGLDQLRERN